MILYSMTATFGKLEHDTLNIKPGLNVIHAPNEWGKSTWCEFLVSMLYGVETRGKSGRTSLTAKERYAPWSGSPMSGRIDLNWNGRNITIERTTKGRVPMGVFRAYETDTGLEVPELNAANCGQMLLGVERSVFQRAGFIRLNELPVTQDDALRNRLNALVTTGDESGDAARLEKGLRELKNRCRYNRTGLLPQAEQERDALTAHLEALEQLEHQNRELTAKLQKNEDTRHKLENHILALAYAGAVEDAQRVSQAEAVWLAARGQREALERECADLPAWEEAALQYQELEELHDSIREFRNWEQNLPGPPELPRAPKPFWGVEPEEALAQAEADRARLRTHGAGGIIWTLWILAALALVGAGVLLWMQEPVYAAIAAAVFAGLLAGGFVLGRRKRRGRAELYRKYGSSNPEKWIKLAKAYLSADQAYQSARILYEREQQRRKDRREILEVRQRELCGAESLDAVMARWQSAMTRREALDAAYAEESRASTQYETLKAMARPIPEPAEEDQLTGTKMVTDSLLRGNREEQQWLLQQQGKVQGQITALGDAAAIRKQLSALAVRMEKLEKTYAAVTLAQQTLADASAELQRRFSPRITKRAQAYLSQLTGGRYDRLTMSNDFSLHAGAAQEDILRDAQWRSDGTVDQLYLALRLAVAEELTPGAPLVLDDALVRFDETRMAAAVSLLKQLSLERQVILFTCQERERRAMQQ